MKTLIVYYSLEGNTAWVAQQLAAQLDADTLSLVPQKAYPDKGFAKFFWGGKSAKMKETPALEAYSIEPAAYDRIILAGPVWAGTFAPPLRTFVKAHPLTDKAFAFVMCSAGGGADKAFADLAALAKLPQNPPTLHLVDPKKKPDDGNMKKIAEFCEKLHTSQEGTAT